MILCKDFFSFKTFLFVQLITIPRELYALFFQPLNVHASRLCSNSFFHLFIRLLILHLLKLRWAELSLRWRKIFRETLELSRDKIGISLLFLTTFKNWVCLSNRLNINLHSFSFDMFAFVFTKQERFSKSSSTSGAAFNVYDVCMKVQQTLFT